MENINLPNKSTWTKLIERPQIQQENLEGLINEVFNQVKVNGDAAVFQYSKQFDKVDLKKFEIDSNELTKTTNKISKELKDAIDIAEKNIRKFHTAQIEKSRTIETTKGVTCWRSSRPIDKIGIYIPGGSAPLFSTVLMLGIPAQIAGCKEIVLCTPPDKKGKVNPAILYCAAKIGITKIYTIGGMQAIAAMTFGTKSIPKVDKIFGPGNQFVTAAKLKSQQLGLAIDMPAGPSEVLVIADKFSDADFVAADLLSQAEHGSDSQVILLSDSKKVIAEVLEALTQQIKLLPRRVIAKGAIKNSKAILLKDIKQCIEFSNMYAPEHLILAIKNVESYLENITNAGSVFIGNYSCESAGDYASGTNHTLPTNGFAKNYSGVSVDSFVKKITFQKITKRGIINLGPSIEIMAEAEQLFAHKNAVSIRLKKLKS